MSKKGRNNGARRPETQSTLFFTWKEQTDHDLGMLLSQLWDQLILFNYLPASKLSGGGGREDGVGGNLPSTIPPPRAF